MIIDEQIQKAEELLKAISILEKEGLDTSSLKVFIRNLKTFNKIQFAKLSNYNERLSLPQKLEIIKTFLEDKKIFPTITDVINFANQELLLDFRDQKESRIVTIRRVLGRIENSPNLREKVKEAVMRIRNQVYHDTQIKKSKKEKEKAESFARWAEILINI